MTFLKDLFDGIQMHLACIELKSIYSAALIHGLMR